MERGYRDDIFPREMFENACNWDEMFPRELFENADRKKIRELLNGTTIIVDGEEAYTFENGKRKKIPLEEGLRLCQIETN